MVYDQSWRNATIGAALAGVAVAWALASMAMLVPGAAWLVGMVQLWALLQVEIVVSAFAGKASGSGGFLMLVPGIHEVSFPISQRMVPSP